MQIFEILIFTYDKKKTKKSSKYYTVFLKEDGISFMKSIGKLLLIFAVYECEFIKHVTLLEIRK